MSASSFQAESEIRRLAEASAWRTSLTEAGLEGSPELEAWLDADADNAKAWRQVNAGWSAVGDAAVSLEAIALRREVLGRARRQGGARGRIHATPARIAARLGAAACIAAVVIVGADRLLGGADYHTALGERRVVTLSDGSRVSLDSRTRVRVRYFEGRRLDLLSGQARFDVAHDARRPFSVHAGDETVVATGTSFNIDLLGDRVRVTLLQGHVTVLPDAGVTARPALSAGAPTLHGANAAVELVAGQALVGEPSAEPQIVPASVERTTAWESGQLVFEDETLAAAAASVSRYAEHPVIAEPDVARLRLSGVFNTGDPGAFVDAVTHYLPVQSSARADGSIVLVRKN
jgi:transmembrane sensor